MRRVELIDGLRGYFLVSMLLTHLTFAGGYVLVKINHAQLGFVQDAQGFVFLSGLLVGAIYARRMANEGFRAAAAKMWRRAIEIYLTMLACLAAILVLAAVLPGAALLWKDQLGVLLQPGIAAKIAAMLLLYQAAFFDILPQYVIYLAAAPPLLWLCTKGRAPAVIAGSAMIWLGVQLGLHLPLLAAVDRLMAASQAGLATRSVFNPLAWQLIFFVAMPIGVAWSRREIDFERLFDSKRPSFALIAAAVVLFFMAWRLAFTFGLVPGAMMHRFQTYENRPELSAVFLLNFVALGYLVAWLMIAGERAASRTARILAAFLRRVFDLSLLRLLGRHSLQVYAWHVILVFVVIYADGMLGPFGELTKSMIALSAVGLLAVPPFLIERFRPASGGRRRLPEMPTARSGMVPMAEADSLGGQRAGAR